MKGGAMSKDKLGDNHPLAHLCGKFNDDPVWDDFERVVDEGRRDEKDRANGRLFNLSIRIRWSDEDEAFIAIHNWPPHKLSTHGNTPEAALRELCTVLQMAIEEGAKLPENE
jgi:predicted RNase H-like HicB family nuclease